MKETTQGWQNKVAPITGDCTNEDLGLCQEIRQILIQETNIILHMAATVTFDAQLSVALKINVLGTKRILSFARECYDLRALLHVSTAYSNCYLFETEEKFYPPPIDVERVDDLIRADENMELDEEATKEILGKWPNSYTFSKAIAENLVKECGQGLPIGIFRPSIVSQTYQEPLRNWSDSLNGPIAGFVAGGLGIIHVAPPLDISKITDFVPVDMCANAVLATTWDIATNKNPCVEPPVYHYTSGCDNPVRWRVVVEEGLPWIWEAPSVKAIWYHTVIFTRSYLLFRIVDFFTHLIPAALADLYLLVRGRKRIALGTYFRLSNYMQIMMHFVNNEWKFDATRSRALWDKMNRSDQHLYFCDIRKISWDLHAFGYWRGLRVYNIKDPMDTVEDGRSKLNKLMILHYGLLLFVALLFVYLSCKIWHLFV